MTNSNLKNQLQRVTQSILASAIVFGAGMQQSIAAYPTMTRETEALANQYKNFDYNNQQLGYLDAQRADLLGRLEQVQIDQDRVYRQIQDVTNDMDRVSDRIRRVEHRLNETTDELKDLQNEKSNLQSQKNKVDSDVSREQAKIKPLQDSLQREKTNLLKLQNELAQLTQTDATLAGQLQQNKQALAKATTDLASTDKKLSDLETTLPEKREKKKALEQSVINAQDNIDQKQRSIDHYKEQLKTMPEGPAKEKKKADLAVLEKQLVQMNKYQDNTKKELAEVTQYLATVNQQKRQLTAQKTQLESQISTAESNITKLQTQRRANKDRLNVVQPQVPVQQATVDQLSSELETKSQNLRALIAQQKDLDSQIDRKERQLNKTRDEVRDLRSELGDKQRRFKDLEHDMYSLRGEEKRNESDLRGLDGQIRDTDYQISQIENSLRYPIVNTHRGQIVHVFVGNVAPAYDVEQVVRQAVDDGKKVIFWLTEQMQSPNMVAQLGGVRGAFYSSNNLHTGQGVLPGLYVKTKSLALDLDYNATVLLANSSNEVGMAAQVVTGRYNRDAVVITTAVDMNNVSYQDLDVLLDTIDRASARDFAQH
ncbi:MAG: hypothetical protein KDD38_08370 [Bdellovibrionales bacterium]|nr:hypothetical protein [Bdellovibrionales bacterium]